MGDSPAVLLLQQRVQNWRTELKLIWEQSGFLELPESESVQQTHCSLMDWRETRSDHAEFHIQYCGSFCVGNKFDHKTAVRDGKALMWPLTSIFLGIAIFFRGPLVRSTITRVRRRSTFRQGENNGMPGSQCGAAGEPWEREPARF